MHLLALLVVVLVGVVVWLASQVRELTRRVAALEAALRQMQRAPAAVPPMQRAPGRVAPRAAAPPAPPVAGGPRAAAAEAAPPDAEPAEEEVLEAELVLDAVPPPPPRDDLATAIQERLRRAAGVGTPQRPPRPGAAPRVSLEERLGARAFIWIAAVALALAGAYLVKYSFDNNILSAPVRVTLGALLGLAMLAGAEVMRGRSWRIAQGLAAAGIATLFADLLAAVHVEHLIPQTLGFTLMALVAAAAVALSLRHGRPVALLGLIGGFATPAVVGHAEQPASTLLLYLFLLEAGLVAVTRHRRWWGLAILTLLGGYGWAIGWMLLYHGEADRTALSLFLLGTAALFALAPVRADDGEWVLGPSGRTVRPDELVRWLGVGAGVILMAVASGVSGFGTEEWVFFGILGAATLVLARLDPRSHALAWVAAAATALLLIVWGDAVHDEQRVRFACTAAAMALLYGGGAYACLWGSRMPAPWAGLSAAFTVVATLIAYVVLDPWPGDYAWGGLCLGLATALALMAAPVLRRREDRRYEEAATCLAVASAVLVALAAPIELERHWIAIAWAALVPLVILVEQRLRLPALKAVATVLIAAVTLRLAMNGAVLTYPTSERLVFNWILYGYGIPIAALALAAWLVRRREGVDHRLFRFAELAALAVAAAMVMLEVRHVFHREHLGFGRGHGILFQEWATYAIAWLAIGCALLAASLRWPAHTFRLAGRIALFIGGVVVLLLLVGVNPLTTGRPVGELPVLNWLLYAYGIPAGLLLLAAWLLRRTGRAEAAAVAGAATLVLLFALVSLEVRQAFHGSSLHGPTSHAENYAYSLARLLFGGLLLVLAIALRRATLRWASLAVVLLTVVKVFVWDMAHLRDLYRVLSFLGLGLALLALAYLYQRYVFPQVEREREEEPATGAESG